MTIHLYLLLLQASVAKLESSVSLYGDKLELKLYGFNDKLSVLLSKILATAKSFLPKEDRFKVCNFRLFSKKNEPGRNVILTHSIPVLEIKTKDKREAVRMKFGVY